MYSETSGVIHALKCVINVTVNNRGKCEFNSFHGGESNPNCQQHHSLYPLKFVQLGLARASSCFLLPGLATASTCYFTRSSRGKTDWT